MPHINRIRVNNVKYNFGTQFYDDFIMRFDGKNALYDLANGGGKSVLMLLLFQNLIPNCTLDDKQPIEKLFRTQDGSTSIHSLIEWKLDDCDIEDGYKYMLTGFCARKAKDDDSGEAKPRNAAAVDYFNYIIFYREYNDNDIVNLPLSKAKERMTYVGLRTYLKELEHKDYQLKIKLFDRKGEYQQFISRYGLYESQWEMIRGINKTEGHVRTYFESNYRTTRKIVEDLLIEEIIQKSFFSKAGGDGADMAKTLLSIKDRLLELSKKKQEMAGYDSQAEILTSFTGRVSSLEKLYREEDQFRYDLVKTYHTLLAAVKQKDRAQSVLLKEKQFNEKHIQETSRKLDTVKIQKNCEKLKNLELDTTKYDEKIKALQADYGRNALALSEAENINDYIEYLENKKQAAIYKQAIEGASGDDAQILQRLKMLAWHKRQQMNSRLKALKEAYNKLDAQLGQNGRDVTALKASISEADRQLAVLENHLSAAKKEEKALNDELSALRQQVNALLVEGNERELRAYKQKEAEAQKAAALTEDEIAEITGALNENMLQAERLGASIAAGAYKKEDIRRFFEDYADKKEKADKLLKIYQADGYEDLKENIFSRYKKLIQSMDEAQKKAEAEAAYIDQLKEKSPVAVSEGVKAVIEYISRCHGISCIAGCEYLKDVDDNEKKDLLGHLPFLPYAVIVSSDFNTVAADLAFREKAFCGYQVPVIGLEAVISGEALADTERIIYTGPKTALYYDDKAVSAAIKSAEAASGEADRRIARFKDQERTYIADLEYICSFIESYDSRKLEMLSIRDNFDKTLDQLKKDKASLETDINSEREALIQLKVRLSDEKSRFMDASKERQIIETMVVQNQQLETVKSQIRQYTHSYKNSSERLMSLKAELSGAREAGERIKLQMEGCVNQKHSEEKLWQDAYAAYYENGDYEAYNSDKDIDVDFIGLKQAYESKHTDTEDKKRLVLSCEKAMARLKRAIETRGSDLDKMKALSEARALSPYDEKTLLQYRQAMESITGEIRLQEALAADALASSNKLSGSVENAKQVIEEKYGYYQEVDLKNMDYEGFIEEYTRSLEAMKLKSQKLTGDCEHLARELKGLEDIKRELERLIRMAAVPFTYTKDSYMPDLPLKKKLSELESQYEQLCRDEELKKAEFEKNKDKLVETLRLLKAYGLADEIRSHVALPTSLEEASSLLANIEDTVKLVLLEKERILKGIEDMQKIQESFVSQCIQRCMDVKTELERLPKMSKITLDNESISMIQLRIPYIKEAFYTERMSDYIDDIVSRADSYDDSGERLKFIRGRLALKHLFSVIVSDMDAIRLSLYKRERIREQSRFLRYEEAVGSTGQSQGIYIQFLIAIINYISAVYSRNTEAEALKKVIFIDNPFGAAKDIYIWEPIFALLEANHVQLIVPARGATPAITGKFDVNYVLGQKLIDGRQQTVVVDYHSSVAVESMEYVNIEFEQEVFDFI